MRFYLRLKGFFTILSLLIFVFSAEEFYGQQRFLESKQETQDLGILYNVYKVQCEFILQNKAQKIIYLLRAESDPEIKIWTSKKSLYPADTSLLIVSFVPIKKGNFNHKIKLITSESVEPLTLKIIGKIVNLSPDDKTTCYYFGSSHRKFKRKGYTQQTVTNSLSSFSKYIQDTVNGEPEIIDANSDSIPNTKVDSSDKIETKFPPELYKNNNLIFLVDVSGSMADSTKLRWLKLSIKNLIENIRPSDRISLLCYSDSVRVLAKGLNYYEKETLIKSVNSMKARGMTRGNLAIFRAFDLAIENYLNDGNNQILLASDGAFSFSEYDYKIWKEKVGDKKILISTLGFGRDKKALNNLKQISDKGGGTFIPISKRQYAVNAIFNEVELRSRK